MYKFSTHIDILDHESMDTKKGNKPPSKVVTDSLSMDSLSFSGYVSIQDQQQNFPSPPNQAKHFQVSKLDLDFEFTNPKANLNSAVNPIKITPADQLISNGQLQPKAFAFQTTPQSLIINPTSSSRSLLATHISSEMSSGKKGSTMKYHELGKASKHATNKQSTVTRKGFGQRVKSFLSPCRECKIVKPCAVKAQTVQRENFKIY